METHNKLVKILLIDWTEEITKSVQSLFPEKWVHLESVHDLGMSFQKLKQGSYNFVILDPEFPLVNSIEVVSLILMLSKTTQVIVLTTMQISLEEQTSFLSLGVTAVFYKETAEFLKLRNYILGIQQS